VGGECSVEESVLQCHAAHPAVSLVSCQWIEYINPKALYNLICVPNKLASLTAALTENLTLCVSLPLRLFQ